MHCWPAADRLLGAAALSPLRGERVADAGGVRRARRRRGAASCRAGELKLDGRRMVCGHRPTVLDNQLDDYGAAYPGFLILNPRLLAKVSTPVKLWIFSHECGHQFRGPDEETADCFAVQRGRRQGWLTLDGLEEICRSSPPPRATACISPARTAANTCASASPTRRSADIDAAPSHMDRPLGDGERRFLDRLGQRRMGVAGARQVLRRAAELHDHGGFRDHLAGVRADRCARRGCGRSRRRPAP